MIANFSVRQSPPGGASADRWTLATLLLTAIPSVVHLAWWVALLVVMIVVARFALRKSVWRRWQGRVLMAVAIAAVLAGIQVSYEAWFGGNAILSFFIVVVFLKWLESETRRDLLLLVFAACILAALGGLYWSHLVGFLHMLVVVFAVTASLVAINGSGRALGIGAVFGRAGMLFGLALPLMGVLFLTFPRLSGPVWDVGLALGLPLKLVLEKDDNGLGFGQSLEPGQVAVLGGNNQTVLVAEFKGRVPYKSQLYWRGPVFWDFDGRRWTLDANWDNRGKLLRGAIRSQAALDRTLRYKDQQVDYSVRLMPHGARWLYALDFPAAPAPEAFISRDHQLLGVRKVRQEWRYDMTSFLDYNAGRSLKDDERARALAFPENSNPRLRAFGASLAAEHGSPEKILLEIGRHLNTGNYFVSPTGSALPDNRKRFDAFFFDTRTGDVQEVAGSYVMLARAAGIPARLVTGFRGGTIVALTDFLIVKQANAHAWAEVWQDSTGWTRVDPKDFVQPPGKLRVIRAAPNTNVVAAKPVRQKAQVGDTGDGVEKAARDSSMSEAGSASKKDSSGTGLMAWMVQGLSDWTVRYDPQRQIALFAAVGISAVDWLELLAIGLSSLFVLIVAYLAIAWFRRWHAIDPVRRSYENFLKKFASMGVRSAPAECPSEYLKRLTAARPDLADWSREIVGRYLDIRYGPESTPEEQAVFRRQVKRFIAMV